MLKKIILIEGEKDFQCDTIEELVKKIIDENFYSFTDREKINKLKMLAIANCINNQMEVSNKIEDITEIMDLKDKFIIKDELTYIYSLLITNNVTLLEEVNANLFTKELDKSNIKDNYIIVNTFAKELLLKYLNKLKQVI